MNFPFFVITAERPTQATLENLLAPYQGDDFSGAMFDWFGLGGKFSGLLKVKDIASTITGGFDMSPIEMRLMGEVERCGWKVDAPTAMGDGCDAATLDNIIPNCLGKIIDIGDTLFALFDARNLVGSRWHQFPWPTKTQAEREANVAAWDKYDAEIAHLDDALSKDIITWDEYARACDVASSALPEASDDPPLSDAAKAKKLDEFREEVLQIINDAPRHYWLSVINGHG